jgi:hypothetical protein
MNDHDKPLDRRMRECAQAQYKPPLIWQDLIRYADEVTSLLIQVQELRQANYELVRQVNLEGLVDHVFRF